MSKVTVNNAGWVFYGGRIPRGKVWKDSYHTQRKYLMEKFNDSCGISKPILSELKKIGVNCVVFEIMQFVKGSKTEWEISKSYRTTVERMLKEGKSTEHIKDDQLHLPISKMEEVPNRKL